MAPVIAGSTPVARPMLPCAYMVTSIFSYMLIYYSADGVSMYIGWNGLPHRTCMLSVKQDVDKHENLNVSSTTLGCLLAVKRMGHVVHMVEHLSE